MEIAQSLEKERDKALKKVEVKKEVINCLEEKTVEVALVLYSLMIDFANDVFLFVGNYQRQGRGVGNHEDQRAWCYS